MAKRLEFALFSGLLWRFLSDAAKKCFSFENMFRIIKFLSKFFVFLCAENGNLFFHIINFWAYREDGLGGRPEEQIQDING